MTRSTLLLVFLLGGFALAACSGTTGSTARPSAAAPSAVASSAAPADSAGSSSGPSGCPTSPAAAMAAGQTATATIETPKGTIVISVQGKLGPKAAGNFVALAKCGFYDGVVFHRLVPGFVIQGGDGQYGRAGSINDGRVGSGGPGYQFQDDPVTVPYSRGIVAMANSGPNTNGSQFFIVLADSGLDPNYSVFGQVTSGMEVVDAIAAMPNGGGQANRAIDPVPMTKVTVTP